LILQRIEPLSADTARRETALILLIPPFQRRLAVLAPMAEDTLADALLLFAGYFVLGHGSLLVVLVYAVDRAFRT